MGRRSLEELLAEVRDCRICEGSLEHGVRPVLQVHGEARILIVGQAPGRRVHESGVPFDDASGDRLRGWLGVKKEEFYDPRKFAILPMGFCYPGTGRNGDLPPRPECAEAWRGPLMERLGAAKLTLVIGRYAMGWHLGEKKRPVTEVVRDWKSFRPGRLPLPHPSPRNNVWLAKNPWFEGEVVPYLRRRVRGLLDG